MKKNLLKSKIAALAAGVLLSANASAQLTAVASGDWSSSATWGGTAPSLTVSGQNITIPNGITVNLDQDVTFSGLLNTFQVNGVLTSTTSNRVLMNSGSMTGTGTITVNKLHFTSLSAISFAGTLKLKSFVNSVTSLGFAAVADISDTLELESGSILLNTNANLTMASGSTVKVNNGSITVNSGVFNSGNAYNVIYVGNSKSTGVELNTVTLQNLYLNLNDNNQTITLGNNTIVNGNLNMTAGKLKLSGKKLNLKGDMMASSGTMLESDNVSQLVVEGSGALSSSLVFASGSSVKELTINRASGGMVKLASAISNNTLHLLDGTLSLENGGSLSTTSIGRIHIEKGMLAVNGGTFNGTNAYDVEYSGVSDATSGVELSASGLNNVMVNYVSGTNKVVLNSSTAIMGKLDMMSGKLDLNGKVLMLNGMLDQSSSSWIIGSSSSELHLNLSSVGQDTLYFDNASASSQTLGKLKVNTSGANSVVLGSKLFIASELSFVAGKLALGNNDLEILPAASISGYDDTKYVVTSTEGSGMLIQNVTSGSAYVTFPIGLSANYSPAYVQQNATGTTGNFRAKCETLYTNNLKAVNRIWTVEGSGVTTVDANLKFGWKSAAELNSFDRTNAYVSHYTNNSWDVSTAGSATAGVNGTYELSRAGFSSLSPFAVVENGALLKVNEIPKLAGIEIYPNPSKDVLNLRVLNNTGDLKYELIDITGRTVMSLSNSNINNTFDVSSLNAGCYFIKITSQADNKSVTKRFVKQ